MNKDTTIEKRAGFTQGPWELASTHPANDPEFFHILTKGRNSAIALIRYAKHDLGKSIDEANARLIASAPELHAQAKLFERALVELQMQGETGVDEQLAQLREILAKVDGGEG